MPNADLEADQIAKAAKAARQTYLAINYAQTHTAVRGLYEAVAHEAGNLWKKLDCLQKLAEEHANNEPQQQQPTTTPDPLPNQKPLIDDQP